MQTTKCLGAQNLVCGIPLSVFHLPPIRRREENHIVVARHLREVMIKIACLLGVVENKKAHRTCYLCS